MTKRNGIAAIVRRLLIVALALGAAGNVLMADNDHGDDKDKDKDKDKVLYIWAQDQAKLAPDFLAVIDFDEQSSKYGQVITTVPVPPPGNTGNEPHHCHL